MHYLWLGLALGIASAVSPGPLQSLVLSQAVLRGWRAGAAVAMAPLASDVVIVALTVGVLRILPHWVVSVMSLAGALLVAYLAWDTWSATRRLGKTDELRAVAGGEPSVAPPASAPFGVVSYRRAVLVNFLNPHAWLFWVVVGAPITVRALTPTIWPGVAFVLAFYAAMIGVKVGLSVLVARGADWLGTRFQRWVLRIAAAGLVVMASLLAAHGITSLVLHTRRGAL